MKLKEFIQKLKTLERENGSDSEVILADNVPVVDPVFSKRYPARKNVVITDNE